MALQKVNPGLLPAENYRRFGVAFDAIDANTAAVATAQSTADGKASAGALADLATALNALQQAVAGKASQAAVDGKASQSGLQAALGTIATLQQAIGALQNAVAGKASQSDVDAVETALGQKASQSSLAALQAALGQKAAQAAVDALLVTVAGKVGQSDFDTAISGVLARILRINSGLYPAERPGDTPSGFTASRAGGDPDALAPLDTSIYPVRIVGDGLGVEVSSSREVWERTLHAAETTRLWRGRWRYVRTQAAQDPENDSVVALIQWYGPDRSPVGGPVSVEAFTPSVGTPREFTAFIGIAGVTGVTVARPAGAIYFRLGLKSYGIESRTVLTDLRAVDISDIEDAIRRLVPPDALPNVLARIDALAAALAQEIIDRQIDVNAEEADRKAADLILAARLTTVEGAVTALDAATLFSRQTVTESGEPALDIIDQQGNVLARFDASSLALARLLVGGVLEISPTSADGSRQIDERGFIGQVQDRAGMAVGRLTVADALEIGAASSGKGMLLGDERGFIGQVMDSRGLGLPGVTIQECAPGVAFALVDPAGWVGLAQIVGGPLRVAVVETGEAGGGSAYSTSEIAERNARALAISDSIRSRNDTTIVGPIFEFLLFLVLGQSLGAGQECTPPKSKTPVPDVLMLGDCVRSISGDYTTYDVVGASVLNPMVARVQDRGSGTILTDAQIAALAPGANVLGESPGEGAVRFARRLYLQHRGVAADPDCRWVLGNAAVPGASVQQLQKGYSPEQFNRSRDWATKVKAAAQADTPGATIGLGAIFWLQGERNYDGSGPVPTDKASYKVVLKKLYDDTVADVMTGILGQADPAVMITYQTSGNWARDGVAIGQAQYELSLENSGWYLAAPAYPVTNKAGGHLDANGSRWLGAQMGKVWHEVVVRRRGWRPTSPLRATWRAAEILVDFHVPAPPLQWQLPYVETTATDYPAKGFAVTDAGGAVDVLRVTLAGDAVVRIVCARPLTGPVSVIYGNQTGSAGNGCLCDSDPTVSLDKYEYVAGSGDYAEANIPALVGKPYPLWNWCIAFNITATRG